MFRALILLLALALPGWCATCTWNGGDGNWSAAGMWTGGVPGAADTADLSAGGTITLTGATAVGQITGNLSANLSIVGGFALTLNNASGITGLTTATANTATMGCGLAVAVNQTWDVGTTLTISGAITGARTLAYSGPGTLICTNSAAWAGTPAVNVTGGTMRVSHDDALGNAATSAVTVANAAVEVNGITLTKAVFTFNGGGTLRGIGTAGLIRGVYLGTDTTTTLGYSSATDVFTWSSSIAPFAAPGNGSLVIAGSASTAGGKVVISGNNTNWMDGSLTVQEYATLELVASATPCYPMGANGGTGSVTIAEGATLRVRCTHTAGVALHRDFAIGGDGVDGLGALIGINNGLPTRYIAMYGNMALTADTSLGGVDNTSALRGTISGSYDLTQRGPGSWELSGDSSAWPGDIVVTAGTLVANMSFAATTGVLGDAMGTTTVQDGASLIFVGGLICPELVTATGAGVGGMGALQGPNGTNNTQPKISGAITLTGPTTMATTSSNASARLSLSGTITGSEDITILAGDVQFDADNGASFTGNIQVDAGRLLISHGNALGDAGGITTIADNARLWVRSVGVMTIPEPLILQGNGGGAGLAALTVGNDSTTFTGNILLAGNTTIRIDNPAALFSGVISDGGNGYALTKTGAVGGTTSALTNANTYSGGTFINEGVLRITNSQALGTGTATVAADATLRLSLPGNAEVANHLVLSGTGYSSAGALSVRGTSGVVTTMPAGSGITLAASATINISTGNSLYLDGLLGGSSTLTLTADNSNDCWLRLAGDNNAFTGAITVSGARVIARHDNALGDASGAVTVTNTNYGFLILDGANLPTGKPLSISGNGGDTWGVLKATGTASWNGPVTLAAASTLGGAGTGTINGVISGNHALTKRTTGTWILAGNNAGWTGSINFYDGTSGRLVASHDNALGTGGSVTVTSGDILELAGASIPSGKSLSLAGNGGGATTGALIATGAGNGWAGTVALTAATTIGGTGSGMISGSISGAFNLTKCSSGTWTLSGNNSGYANTIAFQDGSSGRLVAAHNNALGTSAALTVTTGDTLELASASIPVGKTLTMSGTGDDGNGCLQATGAGNGWAGAVTIAAGGATIGGSGSGTISGNIGGGLALTKAGVGSWTLSGSNTFVLAGGVTINAGTLRAASTGSLGASSTVVTNNATLEIAGVTLANPLITMSNGSLLRGVGTAGCSNSITLATGGTSTFTYSSSTDVLTLSGALLTQGSLIIDGAVGTVGGKVVLSGNSNAWKDGNLNVQQYATLEAATTNALGIAFAATGILTVNSGGTLSLKSLSTANTTYARPLTINGSGVDSDSDGNGDGALFGVDNNGYYSNLTGILTLGSAASIGGVGNTSRISGALSGNFTLTKVGLGSWSIFSTSPSWDGDIIVAAGNLKADTVAGNSTLGSATGTTIVQNGGTLWFNHVSAGSNSPEKVSIIGTGADGLGALRGPAGGNDHTQSGTITLTGDALVDAGVQANDTTLTGAISGDFRLTKRGLGNLVLIGASGAWQGNITIATGMLTAKTTASLGDSVTGTTTVQNGAALQLSVTGGSFSEKIAIEGAGCGTSGSESSSGALLVRANSTLSGAITMNGDTTIQYGGGGVTVTMSGAISDGGSNYKLTQIGNAGAVITYSVANTYGGGTNINAGTFKATHTGSLGTASALATVTVASGATLQLGVNGGTMGAYPLVLAGTGVSGVGALYDGGSAGTTTTLGVGSTITLNADASIGVNSSTHTLSVSDALSGAFTLTKSGAGNLTLAGNSGGFTGATTVNVGTVIAQHANALGTAAGTVTVASGANLTLDNAAIPTGKPLSIGGTGIAGAGALIAVGTSSWGGPMALTAATTIAGLVNTSGSIDGALSGAFDLTKIGAGSWRLAGDNSGYSNLITLSAGRLVAAHDNALGTNANLAVTTGNILELAGANVPAGKTLTIAGNGGGATTGALIATGAGNGWGGPVVLSAATTIGGTGSGTISGAISGGFNLTKCSGGTWTLAGDNSGYANSIAFQDGSSGRLVAAHNNALGISATLSVTSGDALELSGASIPTGKTVTLNGVGDGSGCLIATGTCAWAGGVTLGSACTLGGTGAGAITGNIAGAHPLTKEGNGSWAVSGTNASTTTTINNGIFAVLTPGTAGTGTVTINASGTLAGTGTIPGSVTVAGGTVAPGTVAGSLGTLTLTGSLGGTSGSLALAMSGASADQLLVNAGSPPVTLSNLTLTLSGLPTATATLLSFPNGTHATTFSNVTGLHPSCTGPNYLTNSVTITPATLDLAWTAACTSSGSGTTINRIWTLGALEPGRTVSSESGRHAQVFELRSDSTYQVDVTVTASDAARVPSGGTNWIQVAATPAGDQFMIELKPAGGAYADLTAPRTLVSNLAVGGSKAFDLRFTAPTSTTDSDQKTFTVTATTAVQP